MYEIGPQLCLSERIWHRLWLWTSVQRSDSVRVGRQAAALEPKQSRPVMRSTFTFDLGLGEGGVQHSFNQLRERLGGKGRLARVQLIEEAAQGPEVAGHGVSLTLEELRREVGWRAWEGMGNH